MKLLAITKNAEENQAFINNALCAETISMMPGFYEHVGYAEPWIGYYAEDNGQLVGSCAFKGAPVNGQVEIAYATFEPFQQQGYGTKMCGLLVNLSLQTNPSVRITARTLPEENPSTQILKKNNFTFNGIVNDPDDGDVWEWVYKPL